MRRSTGLCLLAAILGSCGSPGPGHLIKRLDGGEEPGEEAGSPPPEERTDAPVDQRGNSSMSDTRIVDQDGPPGPDGPGPDLTTNPGSCGGFGQPCCGGTTCTDDGDPCNGSEVCMGTCQHQNPVVCTALDVCHNVGTCQPSTGMCSNPPKTGGSCNDGDACTQNDACSNGMCKGTAMTCASGLHCVGGSCACDSTSCKSGKTCVNDACVSCGALNQPCCGSSCNSGLSCQGGSCKTTCSSKMGQVCDTNTCQPGKYDCNGNCAQKQFKNCGSPTKTCDPLTGACVDCGARYDLCCTDPSVEQCSAGPEDFCFLTSNGQKRCWITGHFNQRCIQNGHGCKYQELQCNGSDVCVCAYGVDPAMEPHCQFWDDGSGKPPTPP
jgi:hypothetical protein